MKTINENGWILFLHKKPAKIILTLKDAGDEPMYAANIGKCADCTYPHILKILNKFKSEGLIVFNNSKEDKRVKMVQLTEAGKAIAHDIDGLIMKLDNLSKATENDREFSEKIGE